MATDPFRYFRIEAGELLQGLGQGVIELETGAPTREQMSRILRFAHTLKGAARVVKLGRIADLAHAFEEVLSSYREGQSAVPRAQVNELFRLLEAMSTELAAIDPAVKTRGRSTEAVTAPLDTVRLEVGDVDALLEGIAETTVQVHALRRECEGLDRVGELATRLVEQLQARRGPELVATGGPAWSRTSALADELVAAVERARRGIVSATSQVGAELGQVRGAANRLRLLPASSIFAGLELAARDAAQSLDKPIRWRASGGEHRLDGHVLSLVRDALLHTVRNAVAHGIEAAPVRAAARKPAVGLLEIAVERRGRRVAFLCKDDGRGFDIDGLRRSAITRGVVTPTEGAALDTEGLFQLILKGGLTTTHTPTAVSGRAVGLDVVRDTASRLRGEVRLTTTPGAGTTLEICVPASLSSLTALLVVASDVTASLPVDAVRATVRAPVSEIAYSAESASISYEGRAIPFVELSTLLGRDDEGTLSRTHWAIVVVASGERLAAIGVDRLLHSETIIARRLPTHVAVDAVVAGISLDEEGNPQVVLDPDAVVGAAASGGKAHVRSPRKVPHPVLVIDDSLTTRMLEKSILESAGYAVEVATSAEEGLAKAAERTYSLFVVDVEMPGMDGFEFVTRTRRDPVFREIPAILVTSRGDREDRQRGRDAGAYAYIVKGEFDQNQLLATIRELIG